MYQSEYQASSINILSSDTFEPNVVSKSPTMAELIPIYNACLLYTSLSLFLLNNEEYHTLPLPSRSMHFFG